MHSPSYRCNLFGRDGKPATAVDLTAQTDTAAIILGNTLEKMHRGCAGFEIRAGDRLVYLRAGNATSGPWRAPAAAGRGSDGADS